MTERIGVERAVAAARQADLVLFMVDGSQGADRDDKEIYSLLQEKRKVVVVNKIDLMGRREDFKTPDDWSGNDTIFISAKNGEGMEDLESMLVRSFEESWTEEGAADLSPNLRQKLSLEAALGAVERIERQLMEKGEEELIAFEAKEAVRRLSDILGERFDVEILDRIFERFCVGK